MEEVCKQSNVWAEQQNRPGRLFPSELRSSPAAVLSVPFLARVAGSLRVWSSNRRRHGRRPAAAARPAVTSDPGGRSPTVPESGGSSPPAPQRHTARRLWSLRWPLREIRRIGGLNKEQRGG